MEEELRSIEENDVWELAEPLNSTTIVKCKWVLKKKVNMINQM